MRSNHRKVPLGAGPRRCPGGGDRSHGGRSLTVTLTLTLIALMEVHRSRLYTPNNAHLTGWFGHFPLDFQV